jgi:hypothetical protein
MLSIFIDESGDLGFDQSKSKTQQYFIVGALVCYNEKAFKSIHKAVKRTLRNKLNIKNKRKRKHEELKGSRTSLSIKNYFYNNCGKDIGWSLYFYILLKNRMHELLKSKNGRDRLYNVMAKELVEKIALDQEIQIANLYLDKCKGSQERKNFDHYIKTHMESKIQLEALVNCYHLDSTENSGIQAIDMFLAGIYEKYNNRKSDWYDTFKQHIVFEGIFKQQKMAPL